LERFFLSEFTKELNDLLFWNGMSVEHNSLDISHISVVLERSAIKTNLLTHLSNLFSIVLSEKIEFKDTFSNIWCTHKIDLENFGLQVSLIWSIAFKSFKKESSAFLDFVEF
jgi:hypothetical protein